MRGAWRPCARYSLVARLEVSVVRTNGEWHGNPQLLRC